MAALLAGGSVAWSATGRSTASAPASRRDYVRLNDWARANNFAVRWLVRDRTLQLSNRVAQMTFNVDPRDNTRKAQINGVQVWLSFPLLYRNGAAYITRLDVDESLTPVL